MTLQQFLNATWDVSDREFRSALALALGTEVPRSRRSFARFYRRVVDVLTASGALASASEPKVTTPLPERISA